MLMRNYKLESAWDLLASCSALNHGDMLRPHCSIACKMDTLAHFIRGLSKERQGSRRVFSSLPVLPA